MPEKKQRIQYIVAGIGTDIGKTVVSSILCQAYNANYWKPVQAGSLDNTDNHSVEALVSNKDFIALPETYRLSSAMSPHAAAQHDGVIITQKKLVQASVDILAKNEKIIIELAGGLMVPLSNDYLNIDFISDLKLPVILVVQDYLGSINHTLMSLEILKSRNIPIKGLVFNGTANQDSRDVILKRSQIDLLIEVPHSDNLNPQFIHKYAQQI
jgi:dethiobiotin synthetase